MGKGEIARYEQFLLLPQFLAPLTKGELLSWRCVRRASVRLSVCPSVHASVRKLFLQKTSQKLLTGFLRNFTGGPLSDSFK